MKIGTYGLEHPVYDRAFAKTLVGTPRRNMSRQQRAALDQVRSEDGSYAVSTRFAHLVAERLRELHEADANPT